MQPDRRVTNIRSLGCLVKSHVNLGEFELCFILPCKVQRSPDTKCSTLYMQGRGWEELTAMLCPEACL